MPKVTITLQAIQCIKTEDASTDEIYVIAGIGNVLPDASGTPTKPNIKSGKLPAEQRIPPPPGSGGQVMVTQPTHPMSAGDIWYANEVILEQEVGHGPLQIGIWLMDQDASEDITEEELKALNAAITAAGVALVPATKGASVPISMVANFLLTLGVTLSRFDSDDLLGFEMTALDLQPPHPEMPWIAQQFMSPVIKKMIATMDDAHYDVYYAIKVDL